MSAIRREPLRCCAFNQLMLPDQPARVKREQKIRSPKPRNPTSLRSEIRSPEGRNPNQRPLSSAFGFRISFGFRPSDFGFAELPLTRETHARPRVQQGRRPKRAPLTPPERRRPGGPGWRRGRGGGGCNRNGRRGPRRFRRAWRGRAYRRRRRPRVSARG